MLKYLNKSKSSNVQFITGDMWRAPSLDAKLLRIYSSKEGLQVALGSGCSLRKFVNSLPASSALNSRFMIFLGSLIISILSTVGIAMLSIFGSSTYDVFVDMSGALEVNTIIGLSLFKVFALSFASTAVLLLLIPSFIHGDVHSSSHKLISLLTNRGILMSKANSGFLSFVRNHKGSKKKLIIWNPFPVVDDRYWIIEVVVELLGRINNLEIELHLRSDELQFAEKQILLTGEIMPTSADAIPTISPAILEDTKPIDLGYLSEVERNALALLLFSSTFNLPASFIDNHEQPTTQSSIASINLAILISSLLPSKPNQMGIVSGRHSYIHDFVQHARHDYRLTTIWGRTATHLEFLGTVDFNQQISNLKILSQDIAQHYISNTTSVLRNDAIAAIVILGLLENEPLTHPAKIEVLEHFVQAVRFSENYWMLNTYWWNIVPKSSVELLYPTLSIERLKELVESFERAGMYDDAEELFGYLSTSQPIIATVGLARIAERQGDYQKSVERFLGVKDYLEKYPQSTGHFGRLTYCLKFSWTIVSNRIEDYRKIGKGLLDDAWQLFNTLGDQPRDSQLLWHYYNNCANYAEWDNELRKSIEFHRIASKIPGIGSKWLSGSFVNLGISYRELGKSEVNEANYPEKEDLLTLAIDFGKKGVNLKRDTGDFDELAVALHNCVLSILTKSHVDTIHKESPNQKLIENAKKLSQEGISVQDSIGSTKKIGQLLAENYVSARFLQQFYGGNDFPEVARLKNWLSTVADGFDLQVVIRDILPLAGYCETNKDDVCAWLDTNGQANTH